tara:strand:+ start:284 stop:457 length:174 start_codon:yes stop_codon:yes gene_type:complete
MNTLDAVRLIYESRDEEIDTYWTEIDIEEWNRAFDLIMECLDITYCKEQDRFIYQQD